MAKPNALLEQLKGSLDKPTAPPPPPPAVHPKPTSEPSVIVPPAKPHGAQRPEATAAHQANAVKISVSLYRGDLERMDEIKQYMAALGIRNLSDSEALRLACRSVRLSDELRAVYDVMVQEDRRRKRSRTGE